MAQLNGPRPNLSKLALRVSAAALCVAALVSCTAQLAKRGQVVDADAVAQLKAGLSTKTDVQRSLGSPSVVGTFDKDVWYYIGQDVEKVAFMKPEATDRYVLAVKFDPKGIVQQVAQLSLADGKEVQLVARETPTAGNETTLFQDLFGNIGRFASTPKSGVPGAGR